MYERSEETLVNVLFVADDMYPGFGGQARSSEGHIAALTARGHSVVAVAGRDPRPTEPPSGVTVHRLPAWLVPGTQTLLALPMLSVLRPAIAWADVVHVNLPTPLGAAALSLARRRNVPVVMGVHTQLETTTSHLPGAARWVGVGLLRWYRYVFSRADMLVAPTPFAAELARAFSAGRIEVVSNGLDLTDLPTPPPPAPAAPGQLRRLAYVGRLSPEKRPQDLLPLLAELGPGFQLCVAGAGPLAEELAAEVRNLGLEERVALVGFVSEEEKRRLLLDSELFLMPSPAELQSIATLEAMACGCAVATVGHASSAVPSLVREADAGVVLPVGDAAAQARELRALLESPERLRSARVNARAYAESHDVAVVVGRLEALYRELVIRRAA